MGQLIFHMLASSSDKSLKAYPNKLRSNCNMLQYEGNIDYEGLGGSVLLE